jgi:hypothetical protein
MIFASEWARRLRTSNRVPEAVGWLIVAGSVAAIIHSRRPLLKSAPLFWSGLAVPLWVIEQLALLFPGVDTLTSSVPDTQRGLAFVAWFFIFHYQYPWPTQFK